MDRFLTMTTFTKVVQYASFTAAGNDIGISRALVSRHIADLEIAFGVRLLNRTTRSVTLTEAGQHYYEFCSRILSEIRTEEETIKSIKKEIEGKISIIAPKWIGNLDVAEAITEFCKRNPKITVQLTLGGVSPKTHDFLERGFDVAFQTKGIRDSLIKAKKIADIGYTLAAAPDYLAEHGVPEHPKDLRDRDCLVQTSEPIWRFHLDSELLPLKITSRFSANSYAALCTAAIAGLGIALLPRRLADAHIEAGELHPVLEDYPMEDRPLYAVYAPGDNTPRKIRTLLAFLGDWFRAHPLSGPEPARSIVRH